MEFPEKVQRLALQVRDQLSFIQTEEATKNALIMPFIQMLGYDVFNPTEVTPELHADVGVKKGEKVDYAILRDGKPILLFECKWHGADLNKEHASQLYRYFSVTEARFGILTNGIRYRFFTDLDAPNKMDSRPFYEFNLFDYKDQDLDELAKFSKVNFDVTTIVSTASELKYTNAIKRELEAEFQNPSEGFVRLFTTKVYDGRVTSQVRTQFESATRRACRQYLNDYFNNRIQQALKSEDSKTQADTSDESPATELSVEKVVTTSDEMEAFYIVRSILHSETNAKRIVMRDVQSYCGILLDNNNRKPICRIYLATTKKSIGIFDGPNRTEQRIAITELEEIYDLSSRLRDTLRQYLDSGTPSE